MSMEASSKGSDEIDYQWTTGGQAGVIHQKLVDTGGFSEVHQMLKEENDEMFARKLIRPFAAVTRQDIMNEIRAIDKICNVKNDHIVAVLRHGWLDSSFYYFDMELCTLNLEQYIHGLSIVYDDTKVCDILKQITLGLDYIHQHKEVHRDLKPRNVLFSSTDNKWKITDFGLSTEGSSRLLRTTRYARGTASYRAPELLNNSEYNNKADIWALGCILYELIARKQAFSGDHSVLQYSLFSDSPPLSMPTFPQDSLEGYRCVVSELIRAMIHVEVANRPSTKDILEVIDDSISRKPDTEQRSRRKPGKLVWISNCSHRKKYMRPADTEDYYGVTHASIRLRTDSDIWSSVRWQRHCAACFGKSSSQYFYVMHPSATCMSTHAKDVKWLYAISDDGRECCLQLCASKVLRGTMQPSRLSASADRIQRPSPQSSPRATIEQKHADMNPFIDRSRKSLETLSSVLPRPSHCQSFTKTKNAETVNCQSCNITLRPVGDHEPKLCCAIVKPHEVTYPPKLKTRVVAKNDLPGQVVKYSETATDIVSKLDALDKFDPVVSAECEHCAAGHKFFPHISTCLYCDKTVSLTPGTDGQYCNYKGPSNPSLAGSFRTLSKFSDSTSPDVTCENCGTDDAFFWHNEPDGKLLCNMCGLYYEYYGSHRPLEERRVVGRSVNPRNGTYSVITVSYRSEDKNYASSQVDSGSAASGLSPRLNPENGWRFNIP